MGQTCCILSENSYEIKKGKNNKNKPYNKLDDENNNNNDDCSINQFNPQCSDMNIPQQQDFDSNSEIQTKDSNKRSNSNKKKISSSNAVKSNHHTNHYNSVQHFTDIQQDNQDNTNNANNANNTNNANNANNNNNNQYIPNRKDVYEQYKQQAYTFEKNLDLSSSNNNTPHNQHCYTNPNYNSASNISDHSVCPQNIIINKQRSQYSLRMEELFKTEIKDYPISHHYYNLHYNNNNNNNNNSSRLSKKNNNGSQFTEITDLQKKQQLENKIQLEIIQLQKQQQQQQQIDEEQGSVFVSYNQQNMQYIKILLTGNINTPFAYGIYIFDVYFPNDYPNEPPRIYFQSNNKGTVRFSPLLPSDGRVCLNILGISNGIINNHINNSDHRLSEWNNSCNFSQIVSFIQRDIMNDRIYFQDSNILLQQQQQQKSNSNNESSINVNDMFNLGYINVVRYLNLLYGILQPINNITENNYKEFQIVIQTHFYYLQQQIINIIEQWIVSFDKNNHNQSSFGNGNGNGDYDDYDNDLQPLYTGIVQQHNPQIVKILKEQGFSNCMKNQIKSLKDSFKKLSTYFKDSKLSI